MNDRPAESRLPIHHTGTSETDATAADERGDRATDRPAPGPRTTADASAASEAGVRRPDPGSTAGVGPGSGSGSGSPAGVPPRAGDGDVEREPLGTLGDDHRLSERARAYANEVVFGDDWPLGVDHVDLTATTWETSRRAERRHATTIHRGDRCVVRVAEKTHRKVGFEPLRETIRHELIHVFQFQTGRDGGHGESFRRWIEPLGLQGTSSDHYDPVPSDYRYRIYCRRCGAFVAGRYRRCRTVEGARDGRLRCGDCGGGLRVETGATDEG